MTTGLGSIADLFDPTAVGANALDLTSGLYSGLLAVNSFMQPVTNLGNQFVSTLTGYNVAPILDANVAFAPVVAASTPPFLGPDQTPSQVNAATQAAVTTAINQGFDAAAAAQAYQGSDYGGTGTPSTASSVVLWIVLAAGGLVVFDLLKK